VRDEVEQRSPPAIEPPDEDDVELALMSCLEHLFALGPQVGAGADVANLHADAPPAPPGVVAHRAQLHGEGLLVVGGDTGVEPRRQRFTPGQKPSAGVRGNPHGYWVGNADPYRPKTLVFGHRRLSP